LPNELRGLVADLSDALLERCGIFAAAACAADFLAQTLAVGVALLQRRLQFASFRIDREHVVDPELIVAATSREPAFHKVGLFTNEPDVEHGQERDRINWINKKFLILQILSKNGTPKTA
jgi:hypothetical protein